MRGHGAALLSAGAPAGAAADGDAELAGVVRFLTRWALNLRSALSRNAVVAAGELAAATVRDGARLGALPAADALVAALMLRACSDKRFIRGEAEIALRNFASGELVEGSLRRRRRQRGAAGRRGGAGRGEAVVNPLPKQCPVRLVSTLICI